MMADQIREIVVPVDGSENSVRAARFGMQLAHALGVGAKWLYVFPAASVELIGMAGMSRGEIERASGASGERVFGQLRQALEEDLIEQLSFETAMGDPAEEIIAYTERNGGALVVIGRRGLSTIKALLLGSVSDKVLRYSKSPVTVIT
jgi:nucleotide-binding universal stress UspA family protein